MEVTVPHFVQTRRRLSLTAIIFAFSAFVCAPLLAADFGFVNTSDRGTLMNQTTANDLSSLKYLPILNDFTFTELPSTSYRLWANSVVWARQAVFINYYLQPNLQLGVRYNLNFNFNLTSSGDNGKGAAVPDGWYKLTMAAVLPEQNVVFGAKEVPAVDRYLTSYSSFVRVTNGSVNRVINLDYDNLTSTNVMSILYVELVPLKEVCATGPCIKLNSFGEPDTLNSTIEPRAGYVPYVVELPFMPILPPDGTRRDPNWNSVATNLMQSSLSKYVSAAKLARLRMRDLAKPASDPRKFAQERGLTFIQPADNAFEVAGRQYWLQGERAESLLRRILSADTMGAVALDARTTEQWLGTICTLMAVDYGDLKTMRDPRAFQKYADIWTTHELFIKVRWCMRHPEKIFVASRITHVSRFNAADIKTVLQRPDKFNVMSNFLVARGSSDDVSVSHTVGTSVSLTPTLFKPLDAFGLGIGPSVNFGVSRSSSHSDSQSTSNSVANSMMESLDFNTIVLNIPAQFAQTCLLIKPVGARNDYNFATRWDGRNGLYICEPAASAKNVRELYTQIFSRPSPTSTIDAYDPASQAVNLSLRGDRDVSAFFYLTGDKLQPSLQDGTRIMPFSALDGAAKYFSGVPMQASNLVVNTLSYDAVGAIPSFAVRISEAQ